MSNRRSGRAALTMVFTVLICCQSADVRAQVPVVTKVEPAGVVPGQSTRIVVRGTSLNGAKWLTTTLGATSALAGDVDGNGSDPTSSVFLIDLPSNTPLGIHGLRVVSPGGASRVEPFFVDDLPTVAKQPGHQQFSTAQEVALPCAIDGRVDALTRDFYKFNAKQGDQLTFDLFARRIGSPLDPLIVLYDETGRAITSVDDTPGLASDCQYAHTFARDGAYIVEVRDIQFRGGANFSYRLRIGQFSCVSLCWPMAVQRGTTTPVRLVGAVTKSRQPANAVAETSHADLLQGEAGPVDVNVPADWPFAWYAVSIPKGMGESQGFAMVEVTDRMEQIEVEPNDGSEQATPTTLASNIHGRIGASGDVDLYRFPAVKGGHFLFQGVTRGTGSPADIRLRMLDATGKQISQVDDTGTGEGLLDVTFPADGDYLLEITEMNQRFGPQFAYQVTVMEFQEGFSLSANADVLNVPAGGVGTLTVTAARRGYVGPIELTGMNLPPGVTSSPTVIGPGQDSAVLTIAATGETAVASWSEIQVVGTAMHQGRELRSVVKVAEAVRSTWNNTLLMPESVGHGIVAAVQSPQPLGLRVEPSSIIFGPQLKGTIRVIATRGEGVDDAIALTTMPEKDALPAGISLSLKPIEKGKDEVTLEWTATDKAPLGEFSVVLLGTHKKDKTTLTIPTAAHRYRLEAPFSATVEAPNDKLPAGGEWKGTVKLARNPAFTGGVKISAAKLPAGITMEAVQIPADQDHVEIVLKRTADTTPATIQDAAILLQGAENDKLTATLKLPSITIE